MASRLGPIFGTAVGIADILLIRFRGPSGSDARFSINKFRAKLNDQNINGLWQPSRFVVELHPNASAPAYVRNQCENLKFLCKRILICVLFYFEISYDFKVNIGDQ